MSLRQWITLKAEDWKRSIALVILWAYFYQLVLWAQWFNLIVLVNATLDLTLPAPVIVPWEQLLAGTTTLAAVGGLQKWGESMAARSTSKEPDT